MCPKAIIDDVYRMDGQHQNNDIAIEGKFEGQQFVMIVGREHEYFHWMSGDPFDGDGSYVSSHVNKYQIRDVLQDVLKVLKWIPFTTLLMARIDVLLNDLQVERK